MRMTVNRAVVVAINAAIADRIDSFESFVRIAVMRIAVRTLASDITARTWYRMMVWHFKISNAPAAAENDLQAEHGQ